MALLEVGFSEKEKRFAAFKHVFNVLNQDSSKEYFQEVFDTAHQTYAGELLNGYVKPINVGTTTYARIMTWEGYDDSVWSGSFSSSHEDPTSDNPNVEKVIMPLTMLNEVNNQYYFAYAKSGSLYEDIAKGTPDANYQTTKLGRGLLFASSSLILRNWINPSRFGAQYNPKIFPSHPVNISPDTEGEIANNAASALSGYKMQGWIFDAFKGGLFIARYASDEEAPSIHAYKHPLWIEGYRYIGPTSSVALADTSTTASHAVTSLSSSFALTASIALNALGGGKGTADIFITGSQQDGTTEEASGSFTMSFDSSTGLNISKSNDTINIGLGNVVNLGYDENTIVSQFTASAITAVSFSVQHFTSESFLNSSTQTDFSQSSFQGSTIFGTRVVGGPPSDPADYKHRFTGSIIVSGSGEMRIPSVSFDYMSGSHLEFNTFSASQGFVGTVSYGTVEAFAYFSSSLLTGSLTISGTQENEVMLDVYGAGAFRHSESATPFFELSDEGGQGDLEATGNITASNLKISGYGSFDSIDAVGRISTSNAIVAQHGFFESNVTASVLWLKENQVGPVPGAGHGVFYVSSSGDPYFKKPDGTSISLISGSGGGGSISFPTTEIISSSGAIHTLSHITASGNISASGNIHQFGGTITASALSVQDLTVDNAFSLVRTSTDNTWPTDKLRILNVGTGANIMRTGSKYSNATIHFQALGSGSNITTEGLDDAYISFFPSKSVYDIVSESKDFKTNNLVFSSWPWEYNDAPTLYTKNIQNAIHFVLPKQRPDSVTSDISLNPTIARIGVGNLNPSHEITVSGSISASGDYYKNGEASAVWISSSMASQGFGSGGSVTGNSIWTNDGGTKRTSNNLQVTGSIMISGSSTLTNYNTFTNYGSIVAKDEDVIGTLKADISVNKAIRYGQRAIPFMAGANGYELWSIVINNDGGIIPGEGNVQPLGNNHFPFEKSPSGDIVKDINGNLKPAGGMQFKNAYPGSPMTGSAYMTFWNVYSASAGVVSESIGVVGYGGAGPVFGFGTTQPSASFHVTASLTGSQTDLIRVQNDLGVPVFKMKPDGRFIMRNSGSSANEVTMSVDSSNSLIFNDTMKINHKEVIYKSGSQEVKSSVNPSTGQIRFEKSDGTYVAMKGSDVETKDSTGNIRTRVQVDGVEILRSGSATENQIEIVQNPQGALINASGSSPGFNLIATEGSFKQIFTLSSRIVNGATAWSYGQTSTGDFGINDAITVSTNSPLIVSKSGEVVVQKLITEQSASIGYNGAFNSPGNPLINTNGLYVSGAINTGTAHAGLKFGHDESIGAGIITGIETCNSNYNDLILKVSANPDLFISASTGNVGIGTDNPTKALQVVGDISASGDLYIQNGQSIHFADEVGGHLDIHIQNDNETLIISGTNANALTIDTKAGKVGIGTQPTKTLQVAGDISASGDFYMEQSKKIYWPSGHWAGGLHWQSGSGAQDVSLNYVSGKLYISSGSEFRTILHNQNTGYMGVGNINPPKPLTVEGDISGSGNLDIDGTITATRKSFVIPHPTDKDKKLQYASLEGPENGVYVRGTLKDDYIISLPDYWVELVHEESITVSLTPVGKYQELYVKDFRGNQIMVGCKNPTRKLYCHYVVYGERKDIDRLEIEL